MTQEKYPPNSNVSKQKAISEEVQRPRRTQIIGEPPVKRKPGFLYAIFGSVLEGVGDQPIGKYLVTAIILPSIRDLIFDTVVKTAEMSLYGNRASGMSRRPSIGGGVIQQKTQVPYSKISTAWGGASQPKAITEEPERNAKVAYTDYLFGSRGDAERMLEALRDLIETYEVCSIADFYDFAGLQDDFTLNRWGWRDLSTASVHRVAGGYIINFPQPVPIS